MALSKKASQAGKKKKPGADFGPALAKARQETDHIFKQASEDEGTNSADEMPQSAESNSGRTGINPRSKAAAWAWHQRGGGGSGGSGGTPENVRKRALVVMRRSSRFKAEASRINASYTAEDTVIKAEHKWDPNQSLFDSYELLSVARELDKALKQQQASVSGDAAAGSNNPAASTMKKSRSTNSGSDAKPLGRLLKLIPGPVLCLSEDDVATKKGFKKKPDARKNASMGSSSSAGAFGKISKAIQLLTHSPASDDDPDSNQEEHHHHHQHFHHHQHHHHHHVDLLGLPERS